MVTTTVFVRQPKFVDIEIAVTVGAEPTFYREDVERQVNDALRSLFQIEQLDFGQTLYVSKVFEAVEAVQGVEFVNVERFQSSTPDSPIKLGLNEFPRLGSLAISMEGGLRA